MEVDYLNIITFENFTKVLVVTQEVVALSQHN